MHSSLPASCSNKGENDSQHSNAMISERHITIEGTKVLLSTPSRRSQNYSNLAIILTHPWKLLGGNYHNRVVESTARYFQSLDITTARINFSRKKFSRGYKEVDEVIACANYLLEGKHHQNANNDTGSTNNNDHDAITSILLIGYSYGSLITCSASASLPQCVGCVSIAPPFSVMDWLLMFNSTHHSNQARLRTDIPRLFVIGDRDNFTSSKEFFSQIETFPNFSNSTATSYIVVPKADHFFVGREHDIATIVGQWWRAQQQLSKLTLQSESSNAQGHERSEGEGMVHTNNGREDESSNENNVDKNISIDTGSTKVWLFEQTTPTASAASLRNLSDSKLTS